MITNKFHSRSLVRLEWMYGNSLILMPWNVSLSCLVLVLNKKQITLENFSEIIQTISCHFFSSPSSSSLCRSHSWCHSINYPFKNGAGEARREDETTNNKNYRKERENSEHKKFHWKYFYDILVWRRASSHSILSVGKRSRSRMDHTQKAETFMTHSSDFSVLCSIKNILNIDRYDRTMPILLSLLSRSWRRNIFFLCFIQAHSNAWNISRISHSDSAAKSDDEMRVKCTQTLSFKLQLWIKLLVKFSRLYCACA